MGLNESGRPWVIHLGREVHYSLEGIKKPAKGAGPGQKSCGFEKIGGGDGDRTHDPFHAMEVLSQLSYAPLPKITPGLIREECNSNQNPQKNKPIRADT